MENASGDIGEEVISQLKELIRLLESKFEKNGNEFTPPYNCGNRISE
jgi:hypothetical protein